MVFLKKEPEGVSARLEKPYESREKVFVRGGITWRGEGLVLLVDGSLVNCESEEEWL